MTRLESRFLVSRFESCKNRCCEDSTQVEFFTDWLDSTRVTISDSRLEPESFLPNLLTSHSQTKILCIQKKSFFYSDQYWSKLFMSKLFEQFILPYFPGYKSNFWPLKFLFKYQGWLICRVDFQGTLKNDFYWEIFIHIHRGGARHFHLGRPQEGPVLQQGELSMVCVGLQCSDMTSRGKFWGGHWWGQAKFWGGSGPTWHPPSSAPAYTLHIYTTIKIYRIHLPHHPI